MIYSEKRMKSCSLRKFRWKWRAIWWEKQQGTETQVQLTLTDIPNKRIADAIEVGSGTVFIRGTASECRWQQWFPHITENKAALEATTQRSLPAVLSTHVLAFYLLKLQWPDINLGKKKNLNHLPSYIFCSLSLFLPSKYIFTYTPHIITQLWCMCVYLCVRV